MTYIFKTTATMKEYNNKKWYIDGDIVSDMRIDADSVKNALEIYRDERKRRKENGYFSGYADTYVHPYGAAWYSPEYAYLHTDSTGVIVE